MTVCLTRWSIIVMTLAAATLAAVQPAWTRSDPVRVVMELTGIT